MMMVAITGFVRRGQLELSADPSLFPDETEVILISRKDWNTIAGSDSTRFQLEQTKSEIGKINNELTQAKNVIDQISKEPERAKEIIGDLDVRK